MNAVTRTATGWLFSCPECDFERHAAERSAIHHEHPVYNVVRPRMECC